MRVAKVSSMPVGTNTLPTAPIPEDLKAKPIRLTENARTVLQKRYLRRGPDGKPAENEHEMFWRVAYHVALAEREFADPETVMTSAREYFDLLTNLYFFPNSPTFTGAGTPLGQLAACFTGTMRVTTNNGFKPISELQPGELVLTHKGRYRPVKAVYFRDYSDTLLKIKVGQIGAALEVTPEHPILTPNGWVNAGELKAGDWVAIGMPQENYTLAAFDLAALPYPAELEIQQTVDAVRVRRPATYQNSGRQANWSKRYLQVTPELARLAGYYVSEGTMGTEDRYVRFTFSSDETEYHQDVQHLIHSIFGVAPTVTQSNHGNWVQIDLYSRAATQWFRQEFGVHSYGKKLPTWLQFADRDIQQEFLIGVLRGDGLFSEKTYATKTAPQGQIFRTLRLVLSNPSLIHQIWQMCLRMGYDASTRPVDTTYVTPTARPTASLNIPPIQAQELVQAAFGQTFGPMDKRYSRNKVMRIDGQAYFRIDRIESEPFTGKVYNCEVEDDHTYVTEGVVVHNCFVLAIDDDMGRVESGIFQTLRDAALIQQTGGGNGFAFSRLRPKGSIVKSSGGEATGPVGFLRVYDQAFGEIAQGGSRRGANMAVLRIDHPDVIEFITCKTDESQITNFNISVGITDAFMQAVEADEDFDLINPQDGKVWRTVRARELFDLIVKQAHHNGEPGVLFLDEANRHNPVPHLYTLESTNPCVIGTTRVPTEHGLLTIAELAALETGLMVATDGRVPYAGRGLPAQSDFGVAYRQSSPAWQTRTQTPVLKLTTQHGYSITATPDHKILTVDRGYVPLADLKPGDQLLLQSGEGMWGKNDALPNTETLRKAMSVMAHSDDHASGATVQRRDFAALYQNLPETWSHELGLAMGWLVGDGWLSPDSGSPVGMVFDKQAPEVLETVHGALTQWFGSGHLHERDSVWQLTYGRLPYMFFHTLGVKAVPAHEKRVPHTLWSAPREAVVGFLQGLFTADGTVNLSEEKKSCDVRLASSSKQLVEDVQLLLLNFGIVSKIHLRREAGYRAMPDGKGGQKDYFAHADYELLIDKANRDRFIAGIGFIERAKQDKAARFIEAKTRHSNRETFMTKVVRIEDAGLADVYDLTEPQTSSFIANGLVIHNCGEQFLGPFENCCLGSINLAKLDLKKGQPDWGMLQRIVETSTRFLDDVVSANSYVPAVPQLAQAAHRVRRIGLGIMGLADLMYKLGVRYGSQEGQEFAGQIMEFVRYHAMKTSIELAKERGAFPAIEGSIYDPANLKWQPPKPLFPYTRDWGRPALDWSKIVKGIKKHGIRNGAQTTVAPTGTIATVSGCEGYGCEPAFALAYIRHVNDKGQDLKLQYTSPLFEKALKDAKLSDAQIAAIIEHVNMTGSCQKAPGLPESLRHTFVVSSDVSAEEHIYMQAALQRFTDNAISKTCNFPANSSESDVAKAYMLGWKLGCKGLTVYVTGSREKVVLETHATAKAKEEAKTEATPAALVPAETGTQTVPAESNGKGYKEMEPQLLIPETKKPRPRRLEGRTYRVGTPLGGAYVTVNENGKGKGQPFELFIHTSKAGSETAAISEALGRLSSLILRMSSPISPRDRVKEIIKQLEGIGGERSIGFGAMRVRSLPDGIAQVLREYLDETADVEGEVMEEDDMPPMFAPTAPKQQMALKTGDLCPECGEASVVNEEGCRKCYSCGYSEC